MLSTVILVAAMMVGVAMLFCLWRLIKGPAKMN